MAHCAHKGAGRCAQRLLPEVAARQAREGVVGLAVVGADVKRHVLDLWGALGGGQAGKAVGEGGGGRDGINECSMRGQYCRQDAWGSSNKRTDPLSAAVRHLQYCAL